MGLLIPSRSTIPYTHKYLLMRTINLRYYDREEIVRFLFMTGMFLSFLGSMSSPWLLWPLEDKFVLLASVCFIASALIGKMMADGLYTNKDFILPLLLYISLYFYMIFAEHKNFNAYVISIFNIITVYFFLVVRREEIKKFCDLLAKFMGGFLIISIAYFVLYLIGIPLPSTNINYGTSYSFVNYYLFLLDDRTLFDIIPRFQSIFLEPGHLGTMCTMILFTQIGKWKQWYNISLIVAALISFSLAAYGLLVPIIFLGMWVRGKQMFKKALTAVVILAAITAGSFIYKNGDNMLHNLIMLRLEVSDGKMAGDNRVTDDFMADYESFLQSSDILTGRDRNKEVFGNTGFRVFIYDYGLIGLVLLIVFYLTVMYEPRHKKAFISVLIIATLNFIIRGNLLHFYIFITLYQVAQNAFDLTPQEAQIGEKSADGLHLLN